MLLITLNDPKTPKIISSLFWSLLTAFIIACLSFTSYAIEQISADEVAETVVPEKPELTEIKLPDMLKPNFEPGFGGGGGGGFGGPDYSNVPIVEWEKRQNVEQRLTAFGNDILGDGIDPHTGALVFQHLDVSLPGNSHLEVAVRRKLAQGEYYHKADAIEFGDWQLVAPRIQAIHMPNGFSGNRCTNSFTQSFPLARTAASIWPANNSEYSEGVIMETLNEGNVQLLERKSGNHWPSQASHVSTKGWWFKCIATISGGGQGFEGHAPNGDIYTFNRVFINRAQPLGFASGNVTGRMRTLIVATRVSDVHGNFVNYTYDSAGRLTRIRANDGRRIDLSYTGSTKYIRSVNANGRVWTYSYSTSTFYNPSWLGSYSPTPRLTLDRVTLPDGTFWDFSLDAMQAQPGPGGWCIQIDQAISLKHPQGLRGDFRLREVKHRQSYHARGFMKGSCPRTSGDGPGSSNNPDSVAYFETMAVNTKTLSGPDLPSYTWQFRYESDVRAASGTVSSFCVEQAANVANECTNWTKVQEPDGKHITYYHLFNAESNGGELLQKEIRQGNENGALLHTTTNTHTIERVVGVSFTANGPSPRTIMAPGRLLSSVVRLHSDVYTTSYRYNLDNRFTSYSHGFPVQVDYSSNLQSGVRSARSTYEHNTARWVLGLPKTLHYNNLLFDQYDYDAFGSRELHKRFNVVMGRFTYHRAGTQKGRIHTYADALGRTTTLTNYHRGQPRHITRPDNRVLTRAVDNNGWLQSQHDARRNLFSYSYDVAGRLTGIDRPGNRASTTLRYSNLHAGITQTSTTGSQQTRVEYDAMQRAILVQERALWGGGGNIFTAMTLKSAVDPESLSVQSELVVLYR
jgi:YD repeat-containing protein